MDKNLPDKWIRKAVFEAINNIVVDNKTVACYDSLVNGLEDKDYYTILSTQTNLVNKANKCGYRWESSILIDIFTRYKRAGIQGSRLFSDNICDEVRSLTDTLTLDPSSNLEIVYQIQSFPNDIVSITQNETVIRKFVRIELSIN